MLPLPKLRAPPIFASKPVAEAFALAPPAPVPDERQLFWWQGGESKALEHLKHYLEPPDWRSSLLDLRSLKIFFGFVSCFGSISSLLLWFKDMLH